MVSTSGICQGTGTLHQGSESDNGSRDPTSGISWGDSPWGCTSGTSQGMASGDLYQDQSWETVSGTLYQELVWEDPRDPRSGIRVGRMLPGTLNQDQSKGIVHGILHTRDQNRVFSGILYQGPECQGIIPGTLH